MKEGQGGGVFPRPQIHSVTHCENAWLAHWVTELGGSGGGEPRRRAKWGRWRPTEDDKTRKNSHCHWQSTCRFCPDLNPAGRPGWDHHLVWKSSVSSSGERTTEAKGHYRALRRHTFWEENGCRAARLWRFPSAVQTLSWVLQRFSISRCLVASGESFHWLSLFFRSSTVLKPRTKGQTQEDTRILLTDLFRPCRGPSDISSYLQHLESQSISCHALAEPFLGFLI